MRQEAGAFLRGIIPTFQHRPEMPGASTEPGETAVIVPIRPLSSTMPPPEPSA
jgi:hypothetical protein